MIDALFNWNLMIELLMKYCCSFLLLLLLGISGGFAQDKVECWGRYEISLPAKVKGNPFDIELTATFSGPDTTLTVRGFYDGMIPSKFALCL